MKHEQSDCFLARAAKTIPALTQTFSKGPQVYGFDGVPHYLSEGSGATTIDVDGNQYIDMSMGLGAVLLGHAEPRVNEAVIRHLTRGNCLSLMHPLEVTVTDQLLALCPWADMVRFGKNGSDVTTAAVRVARATTGRDHVAIAVNYGPAAPGAYHGWSDWGACHSSMPAGIPDAVKRLTVCFQYNDIQSLQQVFETYRGSIAAIVMEGAKFHRPDPTFVKAVNAITASTGTMLIIDEVANGLRLAPGGAHELCGFEPDMAAFGKSIGNGVPISCLIGKRACMEILSSTLFTLTYGGETLGLAAAEAVLDIYRQEGVLQHIQSVGTAMQNRLTGLLGDLDMTDRFCLDGFPARFRLFPRQTDGSMDQQAAQTLRKHLANEGVLCAGVHNISLAITDAHVDAIVRAYRNAIRTMY